jgi:sulfatase modifying factor 1
VNSRDWNGYEKKAEERAEIKKIIISTGLVVLSLLLLIVGYDLLSKYSKEKQLAENLKKEMINIEGGTFKMGSTERGSNENPVHVVTVSTFFIGKTEVTQELWETVMGSNPSDFKGGKWSVENVSWYDIVEFCNKLSEKEGLQKAYSGNGSGIACDFSSNGYRLPTEAEWEFAAKGGNQSKGYKYSGSNDIDVVAWYSGNSGSATHDVGAKQPNELGLYDMSGNVWEWCWDWYGDDNSGSQTTPQGPNSGSRRVLRGGSWDYDAEHCRVAYRYRNDPGNGYNNYGFRLVRTKK